MPKTERSLVQSRIDQCEARMRLQRELIAQMQVAGSDTSLAQNLLSAMECSQAIRMRRLLMLG